MPVRSFRVSDYFISSLKQIQELSNQNDISMSQEQILDDMMRIYILYRSRDDFKILVTDEMHQELANQSQLFYMKQAQVINALFEKMDEKFDEIYAAISENKMQQYCYIEGVGKGETGETMVDLDDVTVAWRMCVFFRTRYE